MAIVLLVVCLVSALSLAASKDVSFSKCDGVKTYGDLTELEVIPCPVQPCVLKRGTTVTMKAHFKLFENVTDAEAIVHAKVAGFEVPYPLPNPHACKDSGLKCPLQSGQSYVYIVELPVLKSFIKIATVVKFELQDSKEQDIFCFLLSVKVE